MPVRALAWKVTFWWMGMESRADGPQQPPGPVRAIRDDESAGGWARRTRHAWNFRTVNLASGPCLSGSGRLWFSTVGDVVANVHRGFADSAGEIGMCASVPGCWTCRRLKTARAVGKNGTSGHTPASPNDNGVRRALGFGRRRVRFGAAPPMESLTSSTRRYGIPGSNGHWVGISLSSVSSG